MLIRLHKVIKTNLHYYYKYQTEVYDCDGTCVLPAIMESKVSNIYLTCCFIWQWKRINRTKISV